MQLRLATFERYCDELARDYPFFGAKGIDWAELTASYHAAVTSTDRAIDFYHLLTAMLSELRDPHVSFELPVGVFRDSEVPLTSLRQLPGFALVEVAGRLHVAGWPERLAPTPPDTLAPELTDLPEIIHVEGVPVVLSLVSNLWLGPAGSEVELHLRWANGAKTRHVLRRPTASVAVASVVPDPLEACVIDDSGALPKLVIRTLDPRVLVGVDRAGFISRVDALVDDLLERPGLVLDLRGNQGGDLAVGARIASRFLARKATIVFPVQDRSYLGGLITGRIFPSFDIEPREPVYRGRLLVFVDAETGSMAEHLARLLQRDAGALVLGEASAGAEAATRVVAGPDGSKLTFGHLRLLDARGRGLQDVGVVPDVSVALTLAQVRELGYDAARRDWDARLENAAAAAFGTGDR
jgi:C-terminal processing protease CtpA/Prc